jgi:DNA processing protein
MLGVSAAGPLAPDEGVAVESVRRDHANGLPAADPYAAERDAWTILSASHGLGPLGFAALLARYRTGRRILEVAHGPDPIQRLMDTPTMHLGERHRDRPPIGHAIAESIVETAARGDAIVRRVRQLGVRVVTVEEPAYPERLAMIAMPPHVLFVTGDPGALSMERAVAVVGTRRATSSGRTTAGRIATALVGANAAVISGLAFGIDGAAHEATVRAGGRTVAVIGGGHAVVAPHAHARLAAAIIASGGAIVSELAPDVTPSRGTFPRRNRIISGLADATVVVEAPARSGALITASWALEQGRACFLVPGGLDAPASAGCLSFLREFSDAQLVAGIPQLIADLGLSRPAGDTRDALSTAATQHLGVTESSVAAELVAGRVTVDELVAATDLPVATVLAALTMLERRGLAAGVYGRYRPAGTLLGEQPPIVLR